MERSTEVGGYEKARKVLQEGFGKFSDNRLSLMADEIDVGADFSEYESALHLMAQNIISDDLYDFSDTLILSDGFLELVGRLTEPIVFREENGFYIGVYPGGFIYYGEMDDGCPHEWDVTYQDGKLLPSNGSDAEYCKNCGANLLASDSMHKVEGID